LIRHQAAAITPGSDLVFTVYSEQIATMPAAKLEALVTDLLQKAGVLPTK
jgi:hypothetical protein